jgi:hypothetical protein
VTDVLIGEAETGERLGQAALLVASEDLSTI